VDLLWTLKSHSLGQLEVQVDMFLLGQSEDQAEWVSSHHLNFIIIILRESSSYGCFLMIPFYFIPVTFHVIRISSLLYHSALVPFHADVHLPLQVFFHRKLEIHPYSFPTLWQHLPTIRVIYTIFLRLRLNNVVSHRYVSLGLQSQHYESE
jgi:hypothetical protein